MARRRAHDKPERSWAVYRIKGTPVMFIGTVRALAASDTDFGVPDGHPLPDLAPLLRGYFLTRARG